MKWKKLSEKNFSAGYRKLVNKVFLLPNKQQANFDIKKEGPAVCVLALTKNNEVILTKQFRPGPEKIFLELPGGNVDRDEAPHDAIKRELLEETGYEGEVEFVTTCYDDAYSTMIRHCFVARNCEKVSEQNLDATEFIKVDLVSLSDFRNQLRSGEMTDVEVGYLGLEYLGLL